MDIQRKTQYELVAEIQPGIISNFFDHLMGPNGEELEIKRIGSCWEYENPDSSLTKFDKGVLTCFSINCKAYTEPKILYFDKYRWGLLYVPKYCTWKE